MSFIGAVADQQLWNRPGESQMIGIGWKAAPDFVTPSKMDIPIWAAGLYSHEKAKRAAKWGGIACFLAAARKLLGSVIFVALSGKSIGHSVAWLIGASIVPIIIAVAGARLIRGNGRISGSVSIVLMILDVAMAKIEIVSPQLISSLVVTTALLIFILNGVRAAFALRHVDYRQSLRETFE
jgi:hypothetical protein